MIAQYCHCSRASYREPSPVFYQASGHLERAQIAIFALSIDIEVANKERRFHAQFGQCSV